MKHILLVISVFLFALVLMKLLGKYLPETNKEGMEDETITTWQELWSSMTTRTNSDILAKFFESDMTLDNEPPSPPTDKKMELPLKDLVVKASINSAIDGNGEPTADQLRKVLLDGYRFIDLHIYMVSSKEGNTLYVGNPAENAESTSTQLPLSKALEMINELAFIKNSNATVQYEYVNDPLFIHFMLHRQRDHSYDMLETLYQNYLNPKGNKGLIASMYWYRTPKELAVSINRHSKFRNIQKKALFGFNVQNLVSLYSDNHRADDVPVSKRRILTQMCNFKTGGHSWPAFTDYTGLPSIKTTQVEGGLQTDAKQINVVLPPHTMANNPNIYTIIANNQIQTVPLMVHLNDEGVDVARGLFNDMQTSTPPLSAVIAKAAATENTIQS